MNLIPIILVGFQVKCKTFFCVKKVTKMHRSQFILSQLLGSQVGNQDFLQTDNVVAMVRTRLSESYLGQLPADMWWLIATDGCHLCDEVLAHCQMAAMTVDMPKITVIEVMDFDKSVIESLAIHIPILISFDKMLVYPFGVLDVISLV